MSGVTARRAPSRHDVAPLSRAFRPGRILSALALAAVVTAPLSAQAQTVRPADFKVTDRFGHSVDGRTVNGAEGAAYKFTMRIRSRLAGTASVASGTVTMTTSPATSAVTYSFSRYAAQSNRHFRGEFTPPTDAACQSSSWTVTLTAASADPSIDGVSVSFTVDAADQDVCYTGNAVPVFEQDSYNVLEGGSRGVKMRLSQDPGRDVHVVARSRVAGTSIGLSSERIFISRSTWNQSIERFTLYGPSEHDGFQFRLTNYLDMGIEGSANTTRLRADVVDTGDRGTPGVATELVTPVDTSRLRIDNPPASVTPRPSGTYRVRLTAVPRGDVTVTPNAISGMTVTPASRDFTIDDWNRWQEFTVSFDGPDSDSQHDIHRLCHRTSVPSGGDAAYRGLGSTGCVEVVEIDHGVAGVYMTPGPWEYGWRFELNKGDSRTFQVRLRSQPAAPVTLRLVRRAPSATHEGDSTITATPALSFTRSNWNTPQDLTFEVSTDHVRRRGAQRFYVVPESADPLYNGQRAGGDLAFPSIDVHALPADLPEASALTLRAGGAAVPLSPTFGPFTSRYTAAVAHDVETVTVAATAEDATATVSYSPADADTSTAGHQVDLSEGANRITATVTSELGISRTYTVTVTRTPLNFWSATLTAERNNVGNVGFNETGGSLSPDSFTVPGTGTTVQVTTLQWQPSGLDLNLSLDPLPAASVYGGWLLDVGGVQADFSCANLSGGNTLVFRDFFTSSNRPALGEGGTATVAVSISEAEGDACAAPDTTLSALTLREPDRTLVTLSPGFSAGTTSYTASVGSGVDAVTVGVDPTDNFATTSIAPADADVSTGGHQVSLMEDGDTEITVTVTNGSDTQDYTVTVTRAAAVPPIWSASLTVGKSSQIIGYDSFENKGGLSDNKFTPPGTSQEVTVTGLGRGNSNDIRRGALCFHTNRDLASSVYSGWTLHFGDKDVALSGWVGEAAALNDANRECANKTGKDKVPNVFTSDPTGTVPVCITTDGDKSNCPSFASGTSGTAGTEPPDPGLQARFGVQPAWHTGMAFWTELHFSAEPDIDYKDLRDKAFEVTGARITRAQRMEKSSSRSWRLLVEPAGFGDVTLTLPATEDCAAEGAVCTAEGAPLETGLALAVPGPGDRLAARLKGTSSHGGEAFHLKLHFSQEPNLSFRNVRDSLFAVTGGRITRAKRLAKGSNLGWRLTVEPDGVGAVELELPVTESCGAAGAVCTRDGRRLERGIAWTVEGPPAFSVSDAEVEEAPGAVLAFEVSLSRRLRAEARVDVATRDGTATAGADYEAVTQTLVFAPGETVKTVEVPVLDDAHDEGEETMTLVLSNATGASIDDGEGTGTIVNNDAIPKAWIARFGRTVTGQVLDAVEARLAAPREAGGRMSVAGYAVAAPGGAGGNAGTGGGAETPTQATLEERAAVAALGGWMDGTRIARSQALRERRDGGPEPKSLDITRHALVTGTSFTLTGGSADGGGFASLWGHASVAGFDGREDALTLDGEVTTGFLGADWAAERWTAGLALGHSAGTGGYRDGACEESAPAEGAQSGACGGRIEAELTGLYPYAGLDVTERVSVWLAGGHGAGELTVIPDGPDGSGAIGTDLSMRMGAGGTRIAVLGSEGGEGFSLALKGDGRFTRTTSDAARAPDGGNLAEADADVWLLRLGVEGSRRFALGGSGTGDGTGASLTPSFELALRRDGGDAETGLGADMGGGLALAAPERGLRFDLKGRALVAHEAPGFREWGASAGFGFNPRPATERGLSLSLTQALGAAPSGGMDALLDRETLAGFAGNDDGSGFEASSRLTGELGYGLPAFGGGFTGTPNIGFGLSDTGRDWRLGWRLSPAGPRVSGFEMNLDATRRESADSDAEHGVALRGRFHW